MSGTHVFGRLGSAVRRLYEASYRINEARPWTSRVASVELTRLLNIAAYCGVRSDDIVTDTDILRAEEVEQLSTKFARAFGGVLPRLDPSGSFEAARSAVARELRRVRTLHAIQGAAPEGGVRGASVDVALWVAFDGGVIGIDDDRVYLDDAALQRERLEAKFGSLDFAEAALHSRFMRAFASFVGRPNDDETRRAMVAKAKNIIKDALR